MSILQSKFFLGACIGNCVHIAGILSFFRFIEKKKYTYEFLGPAVPLDIVIKQIKSSKAKNIAISYRLTPKIGFKLITKLILKIKKSNLDDRNYYFGGLPRLCDMVRELNFFKAVFQGGENYTEILPILDQHFKKTQKTNVFANDLISRLSNKNPFPLIRAHFGLSSIDETKKGLINLAESNQLDIISIAPDQAFQEWIQHPQILKLQPKGAGGVPIRKISELENFYKLTRTGNYPLLRIYSGTQDLVENAKLFHNKIHNAWAAIPIFWYSQLDGRGPKSLEDSIDEHFNVISWCAKNGIPVEVNDPHQWGLRMASDSTVVAIAYISAYIAKKLGVKNYIEQLMFNTPVGNTWNMDLARVLAMIEIVETLSDDSFNILRETRTGLFYFSSDLDIAKSQLCASTLIQMCIKPHIVHVVSYSEGDHAANPNDIIVSCKLVKKIIQDSIDGLPDFTHDPKIILRKNHLINEAQYLINFILEFGNNYGYLDPLTNSKFLNRIVKLGILDAPQLVSNPCALGKIKTSIIQGKCEVIDVDNKVILENQRLKNIISKIPQNLMLEKLSYSSNILKEV